MYSYAVKMIHVKDEKYYFIWHVFHDEASYTQVCYDKDTHWSGNSIRSEVPTEWNDAICLESRKYFLPIFGQQIELWRSWIEKGPLIHIPCGTLWISREQKHAPYRWNNVSVMSSSWDATNPCQWISSSCNGEGQLLRGQGRGTASFPLSSYRIFVERTTASSFPPTPTRHTKAMKPSGAALV